MILGHISVHFFFLSITLNKLHYPCTTTITQVGMEVFAEKVHGARRLIIIEICVWAHRTFFVFRFLFQFGFLQKGKIAKYKMYAAN